MSPKAESKQSSMPCCTQIAADLGELKRRVRSRADSTSQTVCTTWVIWFKANSDACLNRFRIPKEGQHKKTN